jgi:hypothetical protein
VSVLERQEQLIELRCPLGPKALLAKSVLFGDPARMNSDLNLMEITCRDCVKKARVNDPRIRRVKHRFNVLGQLVESVVEREDD